MMPTTRSRTIHADGGFSAGNPATPRILTGRRLCVTALRQFCRVLLYCARKSVALRAAQWFNGCTAPSSHARRKSVGDHFVHTMCRLQVVNALRANRELATTRVVCV